jgi:hypothetical protein
LIKTDLFKTCFFIKKISGRSLIYRQPSANKKLRIPGQKIDMQNIIEIINEGGFNLEVHNSTGIVKAVSHL